MIRNRRDLGDGTWITVQSVRDLLDEIPSALRFVHDLAGTTMVTSRRDSQGIWSVWCSTPEEIATLEDEDQARECLHCWRDDSDGGLTWMRPYPSEPGYWICETCQDRRPS